MQNPCSGILNGGQPRKGLARIASLLALVVLLPALVGCQPATPKLAAYSLGSTPMRLEPWNTPYAPSGRIVITPHYNLFIAAQRPELSNVLASFMEGAYSSYTTLTGLGPKQNLPPMRVYMMADRPQWARVTQHLVKENCELYLSIEAGGYCYNGTCVFWDLGGISTFQVAAHEGLHQFLHYRMTDHIPMWAEEGLCTCAEGFQLYSSRVVFSPYYNTARVSSLQSAITSGRQIPLRTLLSMDAGDAVGQHMANRAVEYYAQLWSLILYIRTQPQWQAGLEHLLADAAKGQLGDGLGYKPGPWAQLSRGGRSYNRAISEATFTTYITKDLPAFEKGLRAYQVKLSGLK